MFYRDSNEGCQYLFLTNSLVTVFYVFTIHLLRLSFHTKKLCYSIAEGVVIIGQLFCSLYFEEEILHILQLCKGTK